jgi:hypothetical protein
MTGPLPWRRWSGGHVMVGGVVSATVMVNVHDEFGAPLATHFTVVCPNGYVAPLAGEQVIVPQGPVVIGAG